MTAFLAVAVLGVAAFGFSFAAFVFAAAVYVSSSAVSVKGLIDFRRLADDETDLVLAILIFEDLVIAFALGFAATGGAGLGSTFALVAKALGFVAASLLASRYLSRLIDRTLDRLPLELLDDTAVDRFRELLRQPDRVREDEGVGRVRAKRPQGDVSQLPGKIGGEEVGAAVDRVDGLTVGLLAGTGSGPVGEPLFQGREDGPELTRRERRPQARPPPFGQAWKRTRAIVPSR